MVGGDCGINVPLNLQQIVVKKGNVVPLSLGIGFDSKESGIDAIKKIPLLGFCFNDLVEPPPLGGTVSRQGNQLLHALASVVGASHSSDLGIGFAQ